MTAGTQGTGSQLTFSYFFFNKETFTSGSLLSQNILNLYLWKMYYLRQHIVIKRGALAQPAPHWHSRFVTIYWGGGGGVNTPRLSRLLLVVDKKTFESSSKMNTKDASGQGKHLKPTTGLYLIPIKSNKQKRTLTSWRHYLTSNDLSGGSHMQSCTEVINSSLTEHGSERLEQIFW